MISEFLVSIGFGECQLHQVIHLITASLMKAVCCTSTGTAVACISVIHILLVTSSRRSGYPDLSPSLHLHSQAGCTCLFVALTLHFPTVMRRASFSRLVMCLSAPLTACLLVLAPFYPDKKRQLVRYFPTLSFHNIGLGD